MNSMKFINKKYDNDNRSLLNDSYCTELCLLCAPYIIALAAIYIASTVCEVSFSHHLLQFYQIN